MVSSDKGLQCHSGRCRYIPPYSSIFRHIKQVQSQAYSELKVTLTYLEVRYIQNQEHIQSRGIFKTLAYLEPQCIHNLGIFRTLSNIYDEGFSRKWLTAIIIFIRSAFQVFYFMKKDYFLIQVSLVSQKYLLDLEYGVYRNRGPVAVDF